MERWGLGGGPIKAAFWQGESKHVKLAEKRLEGGIHKQMKEHQEKVLVTWQDIQLIYLSCKKTLNVAVSSVLSKQLFPEGLLPFERDASPN